MTIAAPAWIPTATYRVQLQPEFTFTDAAAIVPYLAQLGVDTLYVSPIFRATPGSTHGYDVTSYAELNPELGGAAGFATLRDALLAHNMGLLIDMVPNHMGITGGRNAWWQDVLENGPAAPAAEYFDIDWTPLKRELREKVLLPILGDQYGTVLEQGELQITFADGAFQLNYYDTPLPIAPPTYPVLLRPALEALPAELDDADPALLELGSIITALERLADLSPDDAEARSERQREQIVAKRRLLALTDENPRVSAAITAEVERLNGNPDEPSSFDALDALLARQAYRLAFWRVAGEEINYRRFFAINELAAIRQEEPAVFADTHAAVHGLLADLPRAGLRIDHPDGLWDPAGYFADLQSAYQAIGDDEQRGALYVVIEKILEHGEALPATWPVAGTVGYEFATSVSNLLVEPANRSACDEIYRRFTNRADRLADLVYEAKYLIMRTALVSEVNVLAQALNRISEEDRHTRDFTLNALRAALREVIANFPVYRTYLTADDRPGEIDQVVIDHAIASARRRNSSIDPSVLAFLRDVLLTDPTAAGAGDVSRRRRRFAQRFQQLTGPVMAKGLEDTAFYQYNRLASLNEVGGDPAQFGAPVSAFHRANLDRQREWPHNLLTSSTHDTKRSEDVRARLHVLSELPTAWRAALNRWTRLNRKHKQRVEGRAIPDRNDEYLLYQTLLGVLPLSDEAPAAEDITRITAYMEKATREAQRHTSWMAPNEAYEAATAAFVAAILDPASGQDFLADLRAFLAPVAYHGAINGLTQQVLKLTSPGVPDLYQGTELWDFSLVDPDNRRPVDFSARLDALEAFAAPGFDDRVPADPRHPNTKLLVSHRLLRWRRDHPTLFQHGDYQPLSVSGRQAHHLVAFARTDRASGEKVIVIVPRFTATLLGQRQTLPVGDDIWRDTAVALPTSWPSGDLTDIITGETVAVTNNTLAVSELFHRVPVAVLTNHPAASTGDSAVD